MPPMPSARWVLFIWLLLGLGIALFSLLPGAGQLFGSRWTSLGHLPAYAALAAAGVWLLRGRGGPRLSSLAFAAISGIALGVLMELLQPLVGRQASWLDLLLNLLGVAAGLTLAEACHRRQGRGAG